MTRRFLTTALVVGLSATTVRQRPDAPLLDDRTAMPPKPGDRTAMPPKPGDPVKPIRKFTDARKAAKRKKR